MSILAFQMPEKVVMEKSDDFHGLFTFKPLEKGYGVTIGNALRRIAGGLCDHGNQNPGRPS